MAGKKKAKAEKPEAAAAESEAAIEGAKVPSSVAGTGDVPVFRADLGESLPAQKPAGVE